MVHQSVKELNRAELIDYSLCRRVSCGLWKEVVLMKGPITMTCVDRGLNCLVWKEGVCDERFIYCGLCRIAFKTYGLWIGVVFVEGFTYHGLCRSGFKACGVKEEQLMVSRLTTILVCVEWCLRYMWSWHVVFEDWWKVHLPWLV